MTGLKSVDKLIDKYGIDVTGNSNPFIKRSCYSQTDAAQMGMPFCFYRKITALAPGDYLWRFDAFLVHKKQRLASYLVNQQGHIIEQVYYLRDRRSVQACDKIKRNLASALTVALQDSLISAA